MEKANVAGKTQAARFISIAPQVLKEIASRMDYEAQHSGKGGKKITFPLTDDIVLYYDPDTVTADTIRSVNALRSTDG